MLKTAAEIVRFRGLIATLVGRELKARYRGSTLGFFWSLVNPLLLTIVYTFVFGFVFNPPRAQLADPYALFLISGLFPWVWVSTSLIEGTMSLLSNSGLIRKAVFPAYILPMVSVIANLAHFILALPVVAGALILGRALGFEVGGWTAVLLPVVTLIQLPLIAGMALGLSALNAHFKDVKDILINVLTLLFFRHADPLPDGGRRLHVAGASHRLVQSLHALHPGLSGRAVLRHAAGADPVGEDAGVVALQLGRRHLDLQPAE